MKKGGFRQKVFKILSSAPLSFTLPLLPTPNQCQSPTYSLVDPGPQACRCSYVEIVIH